jgi:hypothetical protein
VPVHRLWGDARVVPVTALLRRADMAVVVADSYNFNSDMFDRKLTIADQEMRSLCVRQLARIQGVAACAALPAVI